MKRIKLRHLMFSGIYIRILWLAGMMIAGLLFQCNNAPSGNEKLLPVADTTDSISLLTREIETNPRNEKALLDRARWYYRNEAYDAALNDLQSLLEIDSTHLETYLLKSQVEMDYFRSQAALQTLRRAESLWPNSVPIKVRLAKTHLILKQYDRARQTANQSLALNPASAQTYLILGLVAKENQDTTSAIEFLQKAVQNDADLLDAWVELARLKMLYKPEEAAPYFESALQIEPDDLHLWHTYAMYWQNIDSLDQAKNSYQRMIELDSGYQDAYFNQALILMDQDSFQKAIPLWDHFIRLSPDRAKGFYYRGISYEMMQNFPAALQNYLTARDLNPNLNNIEKAIKSMKEKVQ